MKQASAGRNAARFSAAVVIALAGTLIGASAAFAATFDPELVISNDNMRHYDSMSASQIQAFLETQPGPLKDLVTRRLRQGHHAQQDEEQLQRHARHRARSPSAPH